MVRVALAPCSPFSVSPRLMRRTAELAERLDVRLHTHLAEDPDEDTYCLEQFGRRPVEQFEEVGWLTSRAWVAHCIYPNARGGRPGSARPASGSRTARAPTCSSAAAGSRRSGSSARPGVPVGLGCDGSASTDSASLWIESRAALLLGRQRLGPGGMTAREVLDIATRGGAACLGRTGEIGELSVGAAGDLVCWPQEGVRYAGALIDPVEAWLRCGPVSARHTVVAGQVLVRDGELTVPGAESRTGCGGTPRRPRASRAWPAAGRGSDGKLGPHPVGFVVLVRYRAGRLMAPALFIPARPGVSR